MASSRAGAAELNLLQGATGIGRRVDRLVIPLLVATLFAALTAVYFAENAGTDFPEPWTQASD